MTALAPGQNLPWPDGRVTAYADRPGIPMAALLLGADYRVRGPGDLVRGGTPPCGGVHWLAGPPEGITVDLSAVPADVHRVLIVACAPAPVTASLLDTRGSVVATVSAQAQLPAVVLVEIYRREGTWKIRAVGQGYAGGLAEAAAAHGAGVPDAQPVPPPTPHQPVAEQDILAEDRALQLAGMILEDASRTTASLRSTRDYAAGRLAADIEDVVSNPALRQVPAGDAARAAAQARHDEMVNRARSAHARDLDQLRAELDQYERQLPPVLARWGSPAWTGYRLDDPPASAIRAGELTLAEAPDFRLPMMVRLPLHRPLWVDPEDGGDPAATRIATVLVARMVLAAAGLGSRVLLIDVGGRRGYCGLPPDVLGQAPVTDTGAATQVLAELSSHADLVRLAAEADALDSLSAEHAAVRILMITDFPTGLDESTVAMLRRLALGGSGGAVQIVLTGRASQPMGIPMLDDIYESSLRLPSAPGGDLTDGFGGVDWVFVPDLGPADAALHRLLSGRS